MSFYSNLSATASKLLVKYGQNIKFTRVAGGAYDPSTGGYSTTTVTSFKGYGAVFDYKSAEVDGTNILSSDLKLLLENTKKIPKVSDLALVGTSTYTVFNVMQVSPGGDNVITECQLRIGDKVSEVR